MAIPLPCISWLNQFDLMNFQSNAPKNLSFYICLSDKIDFLLGPIITTSSPVALYGPFCKFTGDDLISTHLCGHDPLWTYMWDLRSPGVGNDFWQISHLCGFSCKERIGHKKYQENQITVLIIHLRQLKRATLGRGPYINDVIREGEGGG